MSTEKHGFPCHRAGGVKGGGSAQRDAALRLANARRFHWFQQRRRIEELSTEEGCRQVAEIIDMPNDLMATIRVGKLLRFPRGIGTARVTRLLNRSGINPDKRLRELTYRQRGLLMAAVVDGYRMPVEVNTRGEVA